MQWIDDAIILSVRKYGESKALLRVFARSHGVFAGIVRGATSKANRGIVQAGNAVNVTWQARLAEQMGTFKIEPVKPFAAFAMQDKLKLAALTSACALMETSLPERHPYPKLYKKFYEFLDVLSGDPHPTPLPDREREAACNAAGEGFWQVEYIKLELEILAESGFGLDLASCAATGTADNLVYVSPKSGRAVSGAAGEPYREKLLPLPGFLGDQKNDPDPKETLAGLRLSGYFLERHLAEPHGKRLPAARQRLVSMMKVEYAAEEN